MERGIGAKSALAEVSESFGMATTAIVTLDDIVTHLHNRAVDGVVRIDDAMKASIDAYRTLWGAA